ncbi:MAG: transglycosylase SLT domain-containing protein [Acidobacteria bacterium]|nr:transglycosylase SLT domain-containing protein [Acidobacteriota bacterium]
MADYAAFFQAQAEAQLKRHGAVAQLLEPLWKVRPESPLAGRAAVMAARSLVELNQPEAALQMLRRVPANQLPQPQAGLLLARATEDSGDALSAAARYQGVFYGYPLSDEAEEAGACLARLERELGEKYPPVLPQARLERARILMEGRRAAKAKEEFERMAPLLGGLERQQAQVRVGAALYHQRRTEAAVEWLRALELTEAEADAERRYYIVASYRRQDADEAMYSALDELSRRAPNSPWRLKALVLAGNEGLVRNDPNRYLPLYSACAEAFAESADAPYCHWKVVWRAYLDRRSSAAELLREHLVRFPSSEKAGAAVYFLGRLAEETGDAAYARRLYGELQSRFPNYYYTLLAGERLKGAVLQRAGSSVAADQFLARIRWPERNQSPDFRPDAASAQRIARARVLAAAGLEKWAEFELRYAARNGGNRFALAVEMAETATRRGAPEVGLRLLKATVPEYLWVPREAAPRSFWKLAFPMPFRQAIVNYSKQRGLDPYLVAALIRQESEFDPQAVSPANAIGLMQVMPATGRELGRKVGVKGVRVSSLKNPTLNLNLGTYFLQRQLEARNGSVEETLAGYNAGPSRVPVWKTWGDYREPAEFVETIPFGQTRDYVQIILRNADIYRWLYAADPLPAAEKADAEAPAAPAAASKKTQSPTPASKSKTTKGKSSATRKK